MSRQEIYDKKAIHFVKRELKILRTLPSLRYPHLPLPSCVLTPYYHPIPDSMQKQVFDPDVWPLARLAQHLHPHALRRGRRVAALDPRTRNPWRGCVLTNMSPSYTCKKQICASVYARVDHDFWLARKLPKKLEGQRGSNEPFVFVYAWFWLHHTRPDIHLT